MSSHRDRARLAGLMALPVVVIALVVVGASLVTLSHIGPSESAGADAGLARIGSDLALVIVTDGSGAVAGARGTIVVWGLVIPLLVAAGSLALSWTLAGKIQGRIEASNRVVADADRQRDDHLHDVVHELRTPLAVVGTNLELVSQRSGDSDRYLQAARRAVSRMARTVDDLDSHGRLTVTGGEGMLDLGAAARAAGLELVGLAQRRGVNIVVADKSPLYVVGFDAAAVRTAMGNFLTNAIRYAPSGSAISIDWGRLGEWAWLSVTDVGPGISPDLHARVFERGWQGDHARDRNEGTGLGLTIARQLTEAQGGSVTVDSEEGRGATFTLWLPEGVDADSGDVIAADGIHPRSTPWLLEPAS